MRKALYISTILLILSCENETTEIQYYPSTPDFSTERAVLFGLDTTDLNFRQITNKVASYYGKWEYLTIEFNDGRIKKRITPFVYDGGLIKYRNVLPITSDSILKEKGFPISELKQILKKHYLNKDENFRYAKSPNKALVEVTIDTSKTGKELEKVLVNLTRVFDEIKEEVNDSIELKVFFDYFRQIPPPPMPKMQSKNE
ncbi:hypothetical protein [Lacinutrix sp. 5H-3-7-4]|uniref:hypothetical protein n=1 Tax=Lacinutrix sp. (strain 5H-3-7-4) TaxID=983544 RepID=UPI0002F2836A|nr:hypothetical protein [Lacinutrix sp. 5H-3-7-4]